MKLSRSNRPVAVIFLIAAQAFCAAFFLYDVIDDGITLGLTAFASGYFLLEAVATVGLIGAVVFELRYLMWLMRRKAHLERQVSLASGAFQDILEDHFSNWRLTPSERDVATFTVKGLSISEIAEMRGSAEGTVKSQLNAIYRKSEVSGRSGLLSLLIEDLMGPPLITDTDNKP